MSEKWQASFLQCAERREGSMKLKNGSIDTPEDRRLYRACVIAEPIRRAWAWLENEDWSGFSEDLEWHPTAKLKFYRRTSLILERWSALIFLWVARNGEDWTFWRAVKATVCLLLWLDHKACAWSKGYAYHYGPEVAWWSDSMLPSRFYPYPGSWRFIQVGEGWRHWWIKFDSDSTDEGYP